MAFWLFHLLAHVYAVDPMSLQTGSFHAWWDFVCMNRPLGFIHNNNWMPTLNSPACTSSLCKRNTQAKPHANCWAFHVAVRKSHFFSILNHLGWFIEVLLSMFYKSYHQRISSKGGTALNTFSWSRYCLLKLNFHLLSSPATSCNVLIVIVIMHSCCRNFGNHWKLNLSSACWCLTVQFPHVYFVFATL